jgi:hypothetical protein
VEVFDTMVVVDVMGNMDVPKISTVAPQKFRLGIELTISILLTVSTRRNDGKSNGH